MVEIDVFICRNCLSIQFRGMLLRKSAEHRFEAGIDEAGRGCLAGNVYVAVVILPEILPEEERIKWQWIRDSKKLSARRREDMRQYIQERAIAWAIDWADPAEILEKNILGATMASMNRAIKKISERQRPDFLLVDGNYFRRDADIDIAYECVEGGDATYMNIAAASILAKTYHDDHVKGMLREHPEWAHYGWERNMCYGTSTHINAIIEHGITPVHRQGFGICRNYIGQAPVPRPVPRPVFDFVDDDAN
jgi:ribonuclease HII